MRSLRSTPLLVLLLCGVAKAQPQSSAQTRYAAINKLVPSCRIVKMDLSGRSTEGGLLTAYLKNGQPQKIVARYYGESGRATEEYYFWKGSLFFELRTDEDYEFPIGAPKSPGKVRRTQERFYFEKGKLVRWLSDDSRSNDLKQTSAIKAEKDILSSAREFLAKMRNK